MGISLSTYLEHAPAAIKETLKSQHQEGLEGDSITCGGCEMKQHITHMHKCYYCGVWFCHVCAGVHFGETYHDYIQRRRREAFVKRAKEIGYKTKKENDSELAETTKRRQGHLP